MIELDFDAKLQQTKIKFEKLGKSLKDLTPVWEKFIPEYREVVKTEFKQTKGKIMQGKRWDKLNPDYLAWKRKKYGFNKPILVISGDLRRDAENFNTNKRKQSLSIYIDGPDYYKYVHDKRAYLYTPKEELPMIYWRLLIEITEKELLNNVK
jgi:phage gpG-like protein